MKNKQIKLALIFMAAAWMAGCGEKGIVQESASVQDENVDETGFGITLEEQKMCAEYVSGVLMKYNAGSNMRVLEGEKLAAREAKEQLEKEKAEKREQLAAEYEDAEEKKKQNKNKDSQNTDTDSAGTKSYISDLSEAVGTNGFSVSYRGYELTDSYPENGEDAFLAVEAVQGKVLLVAKFDVTNIGGETEEFNLFSSKGKYKLKLNGNFYNAQQTLLLNDLSMYEEEIAAQDTKETVLVFEVKSADAAFVENMELDIIMNDKVSTMLLAGGETVVNTVIEETELSDLAAEYEAALQMEEGEVEDEELEFDDEENHGNVTVVGSNSTNL